MIKKSLFLLLCLVSYSAEASLRELIKISFKNNLSLQQSEVNQFSKKQDILILNSRLDLNLNFETSFVDSNFERDPFSLVAANRSWSNQLTLSKSFEWGGELSFRNQHRELDPKFNLPKSYLFQQQLIYTQDLSRNFLGKSFKADQEAVELESQVAALEFTIEEKDQLLSLSKLYIEIVSLKEQIKLEEQSIERLKKRLTYVIKQVRDGIREKVDEYRARENLLARESALRDVEHRYWQVKEQIGVISVVNISDVAFKDNSLNIDWTKPWDGWHLKDNVDRQLLLKRLDSLSAQSKARAQENNLDLKVVTSYGTNNWEVERSNAISGGYLGQDNDEKTIALQLNIPFGNRASDAEFQKIKAQKMMLERYARNWDNVLINTASTLGERHKLLAYNLENAKQRVTLAQKALNSYTKLYAKGRVNLDQLITAEEQLVADQRLVITSNVALANLTLDAQAIAGRLPNFLMNVIDL